MSYVLHGSMSPTENGNDQSAETQYEQRESKPVDGSNVSGEFSEKFLTTIPSKFKSLRGTPITVYSENPVDLIKSLGEILEITDYPTNMAAFWFLDTLADQILHHHKDLDEYYLSVLISWLVGEITLLRERKHSRKGFFKEMRRLFTEAANEVSKRNRLGYWDEIDFKRDAEKEFKERETQDSIIQEEYMKSMQKEPSQERRSDENNHKMLKRDTPNTASSNLQETTKHWSSINAALALDKVIESTYDMYGDELRYDLVYAVFVEPVEVQTYNLPFVFRTPRPIKSQDKYMSFDMQLRHDIKKIKEADRFGKGRKKSKAIANVPATPAPSLCDEEMLKSKRQFILPLIEAHEAFQMFETYMNDV